jgi:hypothetical protein
VTLKNLACYTVEPKAKPIDTSRFSRHGCCVAINKNDSSLPISSGVLRGAKLANQTCIPPPDGGILSVTLAGLAAGVHAQGGGGGGAGSGAARAAEGAAASDGGTGSGGMGAPGAPPGHGHGFAVRRNDGGQPTNPIPNNPPSTGTMSEPGSDTGGSTTGSLGRNPTNRSGPTNPNSPAPRASGPAGSGAPQ